MNRSRFSMVVIACAALPLISSCGGSTSSATNQESPSQYSIQFDGSDDVVQAATGFALFFGVFTVEAWVKFTNVTSTGSFGGIVEGPSRWALYMQNGTPGQASCSVCVPGCKEASSPAGAVVAGVWTHIAATSNGNTIRVYIDGKEVGTVAHSGLVGNAVSLNIGLWSGTGGVDGLVDEVRVWNLVRTESEIQATMGTVVPGDTFGLVAYFRFEEGAGQTTMDSSLAGNTATFGATTAAGADDPVWSSDGAPVK